MAVEKGQVTAYMTFNKNFTMKTGRLREDQPLTDRDIEETQFNVYSDKSSKYLGIPTYQLKKLLTTYLYLNLESIITSFYSFFAQNQVLCLKKPL